MKVCTMYVQDNNQHCEFFGGSLALLYVIECVRSRLHVHRLYNSCGNGCSSSSIGYVGSGKRFLIRELTFIGGFFSLKDAWRIRFNCIEFALFLRLMKGLENSFVIEVRIVKNIFFNLLFRNFICVSLHGHIFIISNKYLGFEVCRIKLRQH